MRKYMYLFVGIFTFLILMPFNVMADEITNINITGFNEPVIGFEPKFNAKVSDDANYTVYLESWMGNNSTMIESKDNPSITNIIDVFKKDVVYTYSIYLKAKDGYTFSDTVTANIDGINLVDYRMAGNTLIFEYEYGVSRDVDFKILDVMMPLEDAEPSYTGVVPESANYKIWKQVWRDSEGNEVTGKFESGEEYTYYCLITPINNASFSKPLYATVNGNNMVYDSDEGNLYVFYYKYKLEDSSYKVVFDANGGKFDNKNTYVIEEWDNSYYDNLVKPVRKGYDFKGYFTEKVGGTSLESYLAEAGIDSDLTFYAQWEESVVNPDTGDNIGMIILISIVSLAGIVAFSIFLKRERTN